MSAGKSIAHDSARLHVRGEAQYVDDTLEPRGMLHAAIATSESAHARLMKLDLTGVWAAEGVVAVLTADDVPGVNNYGPVVDDDPIFAVDTVEYVGQPVFAVIATTTELARRAVSRAEIVYAPLETLIEAGEALAAMSLIEPSVEIMRGQPDEQIAAADHKLTGRLTIGGQEHFYLEGQIALATPLENKEMHVACSTQSPGDVQRLVARALGRSSNMINVTCRRLGGGFGGKETQPALFACIAAIAAAHTGAAVKLRVRRDQDMSITGKRHDFIVDFAAGYDSRGLIRGLELRLTARCGRSADLSNAVNTRALLHCDNCYYLPDVRLVSHRCRTNTASNTAFRGFGGPQAILAIEHVIDEVARNLELEPLELRKQHFYGPTPKDTTHYGMRVQDTVLRRLVGELENTSNYHLRRAAARDYNASSSVLKKGLALVPVKFGISFTQTHLNQAGALVHVYQDGTVLLNHGGTEMGQGLHTKVAQVVAQELGIAIERVRIAATDTGRVPNASPTAASASSDLNGKAAQAAACTLRERLTAHIVDRYGVVEESVVFENDQVLVGGGKLEFDELIAEAYEARISLSATGYYRTPKIHFDAEAFTGRPFYYFVYGAAVCEVLLDTFTGEHRLEQVDILQDAGRSLNPELDRGQIEGAFLQGVGWLTSEELYWNEDGGLATLGPATYKIPTSYDWPSRFNVNLAEWSINSEPTIFGSKGVGEPPLMLATAVFLAIKDALASVAPDGAPCPLNAPATPAAVLTALQLSRGTG